jgi:glycosyltransferase involved in cell wall biosynthesis
VRVLFAAPLAFGLQNGGMQLQVSRTREALRALGVEVVDCDPWRDSLRGVDVCHVFTTAPELAPYVAAARARGVPVAVSPIFNTSERVAVLAAKARAARRVPGSFPFLNLADQVLASANAVLPLSIEEQRLLERVFGVPASRSTVVPNGAEERFAGADPELFVQRFGFRPDVLFVGRIDHNKNVLRLVSALEGTGLTLAVVGSASPVDPGAFAALQARAGDGVVLVGGVEHDDPVLASAYAASRVFCLPSLKEVMPLTVLEAVLAGCSVVVTRNTAMGSLLGDAVRYVDPRSVAGIRRAVAEAAADPAGAGPLRARVLETLTWPRIAERLVEVYQRLAGCGPALCRPAA